MKVNTPKSLVFLNTETSFCSSLLSAYHCIKIIFGLTILPMQPIELMDDYEELPIYITNESTTFERMVSSSIGALLTSLMSVFTLTSLFSFVHNDPEPDFPCLLSGTELTL